WNTIKDFYEYQTKIDIRGCRDAILLAFNRGLIEDGEIWMRMIHSRKMTTYTYNEDTASDIVAKIIGYYYKVFIKLEKKLERFEEIEKK
ncbi:nucleotidyltransferase substrate binding protein, HI0074 family, partial [Candidatus Scalindua japonica]